VQYSYTVYLSMQPHESFLISGGRQYTGRTTHVLYYLLSLVRWSFTVERSIAFPFSNNDCLRQSRDGGACIEKPLVVAGLAAMECVSTSIIGYEICADDNSLSTWYTRTSAYATIPRKQSFAPGVSVGRQNCKCIRSNYVTSINANHIPRTQTTTK